MTSVRHARQSISSMSEASLPERIRDVEHLEDLMTTPGPQLRADMAKLAGDIIILGVGGKMGPTLARLAKHAAPQKRVIGVARVSENGLRDKLARWGLECRRADLRHPQPIDTL